MIIYGYRNRKKELGTGNFYCSTCGVQRPYRHKKIARYFTLFFISLFPLGTLSEYVECQGCGQTYKTDVLSAASTTSVPISETDRYFSIQGNPAMFETAQKTGKRNSCLPLILAGGGILSILGGLLMGVAMIVTQSDPASANLASFVLAVLCCPTPMIVLGLLAIGAGIYLFRRNEDVF